MWRTTYDEVSTTLRPFRDVEGDGGYKNLWVGPLEEHDKFAADLYAKDLRAGAKSALDDSHGDAEFECSQDRIQGQPVAKVDAPDEQLSDPEMCAAPAASINIKPNTSADPMTMAPKDAVKLIEE